MAKTSIGGQALLEGVMMRGKTVSAMAVRDETGVIRIETTRLKNSNAAWKKIPVVRGVINFFDSLIFGTKTMLRSGDIFMLDENADKKATDKESGGTGWFIFFTVLVSLAFAVGLFFLLPNLISQFLMDITNWNPSSVLRNLVEGLIRILIFAGYVLAISLMKEIRRVFMYHGAEHRTINCFEAEKELTVENVQSCSTVHDRCGTSFMFFVMFVAILVFSISDALVFDVIGLPYNIFTRLFSRLLFLPLVAGLSYELLKGLSKTNFILLRPLKWPGKLLQKLTTKIPDGQMAEVAIAAFNAVIEREDNPDLPDLKFPAQMKLGEFKEKLTAMTEAEKDYAADIDWILCEVTGLKRDELKDTVIVSAGRQIRAEKYLRERMSGKPLQYVFGYTEFFGRRFKVNSSVLVPRFETELLVDKVLPLISKTDRVLDLCCGSGAIGVTVQLEKGSSVVCTDISASALTVAEQNAKKLKAKVEFVKSDLFENVKGKFNVILSNPPYVKTEDIQTLDTNVKDFEPREALDGGQDGLDFYRRIIPGAKQYMQEGGLLVFEIGAGQAAEIVQMAQELYEVVQVIRDYSSIERIVILKSKG